MSDELTPRQPDKLDQLITLVQSLDVRIGNIETRLDRIETRLDHIETRLDRVETRLDHIETRLDRVETRLSVVEERLSVVEERLSVVEERLAPTNQLPKIYAEVHSINQKLDKLNRSYMSSIELLGDLAGRSLDLERRVKELEENG